MALAEDAATVLEDFVQNGTISTPNYFIQFLYLASHD